MRRCHSTNRVRAFTLIELLTVIAVLSLLMAILLPALGKARDLGKRSACQGNLGQIAWAWWMYFNDYEGRAYQGLNADVDFGGIKGTDLPYEDRPLNKYLLMPKVWRCPADTGRAEKFGQPVYVRLGTSYRTNHIVIGPDQMPGLQDAMELSDAINLRLRNLNIYRIENPSLLLLVGDFGWVDEYWPLESEVSYWHRKPSHFNLAYVDSHVEFVKIQKSKYHTDQYTVIPWRDLYKLAP